MSRPVTKYATVAAITAIAFAIGGYFVGYEQDRTLLVESLSLSEMMAIEYPGLVNPLYPVSADADPVVAFGRTVSKDEYIAWLEKTLRAVQVEERQRGVSAATKSKVEFIKSITEASNNKSAAPMTASEEEAIRREIKQLMWRAYVSGVLTLTDDVRQGRAKPEAVSE